mgnify:CR=1 FL=1
MPSLKSIRLDTSAMDNGVWLTFFTDPVTKKSIRVRIASMNSPNYTKSVQDLTRARRAEIKANGGNLPSASIEEIQRVAAGQALVTGWEGIENDQGEEIPFSREASVNFMLDRAYSEFYEWVIENAGTRERYREQTVALAAKN